MDSFAIRQSFLDFFSKKNHKIVRSSSLYPDAPNLLFTNAGMNQFVPIFLGKNSGTISRVANSQKCIRAGGKHNDLDDVGFDTYHHTFFEMLGNWSFGDYFKKESIEMAWELLTKIWKFPKERLYATVYCPQASEPSLFDDESYKFWKEIFIRENLDPKIHIIHGSKCDNFWMMGDTGPCGPCSEIHMDLTPIGDTKGQLVNSGSPWCIELWNLVFIQFNATADGKFENLSAKHVDTGMGLERVVGIISKTKNFSDFSQLPSNYDSDLFYEIFQKIETLSEEKYMGTIALSRGNMSRQELVDFWMRAIADHVRTLTFSISDGIFPSNEGRGYVLRRILRRAVMFGNLLHLPRGFFAKLSEIVIEKMGRVFSELIEQKETVSKILENEEAAFAKTIDRGLIIFNDICRSPNGEISGKDAFLLRDTYGFPLDLTQLLAEEKGLVVDVNEFETCMEKQRILSRESQKKSSVEVVNCLAEKTSFVGYDINSIDHICAIVTNIVKYGDKTFVVVDRTPFYAECGGQIGDRGIVEIDEKIFSVIDVKKDANGSYLHEVSESVDKSVIGKSVFLSVDKITRMATSRNHSATHLLQFALKSVLGSHVNQAGSHVDDKRLRFDFNTFSAPTRSQLIEVEKIVEEKILECAETNVFETKIEGLPSKCIANFGDKYGDIVRVVEFGNFSCELCGGCHVRNTSEIVCFKIISCSAIASGVRRIEAVTGKAAYYLNNQNCEIIEQLSKVLSCLPCEISTKVDGLILRNKDLEKTVKSLRKATLQAIATELCKSKVEISNELWKVEKLVDGVSADEIKTLAMDVLSKIKDGIVVLSSHNNGKCSVVVCCSQLAISAGYRAGNIVREISERNNGSGGGRPDFAMGGYCL